MQRKYNLYYINGMLSILFELYEAFIDMQERIENSQQTDNNYHNT